MKRLMLLAVFMLTSMVSGAEITVTKGPAMRPLPPEILCLSDAEYQEWAVYNNYVTRKKAAAYFGPDRYAYGSEVAGHTRQRHRSGSKRSTIGSGKSRTTHTGNTARTHTSNKVINRPLKWLNPEYTGPGPIVIYNPYIRTTHIKGAVDLKNVFIPSPTGPVTLFDIRYKRAASEPESVYTPPDLGSIIELSRGSK